MTTIEQAQYILDHPLEHVHPEGYRDIIKKLIDAKQVKVYIGDSENTINYLQRLIDKLVDDKYKGAKIKQVLGYRGGVCYALNIFSTIKMNDGVTISVHLPY